MIWLGVIQHPGRLALSRSMPEPGAHSILPCFATGPVQLLTDQVVSSSHEIPSPSPAVAEEEEEEEEEGLLTNNE